MASAYQPRKRAQDANGCELGEAQGRQQSGNPGLHDEETPAASQHKQSAAFTNTKPRCRWVGCHGSSFRHSSQAPISTPDDTVGVHEKGQMESSLPAQASYSSCRAGVCRDCCLQRRLAQLHVSSGSAFWWQAKAACCRSCHASQAIDSKRGAPANMLRAGREEVMAQRMQLALIPSGRQAAGRRLAGSQAGMSAGWLHTERGHPSSTHLGHERCEDQARHGSDAIRAVDGAGVAAAAGGREPAGCSTRGSVGAWGDAPWLSVVQR